MSGRYVGWSIENSLSTFARTKVGQRRQTKFPVIVLHCVSTKHTTQDRQTMNVAQEATCECCPRGNSHKRENQWHGDEA
eukprot:1771017-Pyramimonas_sp.AAC.1